MISKFISSRTLVPLIFILIDMTQTNENLLSPDSCNVVTIAHRGASGYIPENTLAAFALAIKMGADYLDLDLAITKDKQLIARYGNELGVTTNVADHPEFAERRRTQKIGGLELDGWFAEDFTLVEIKTLRANERLARARPDNVKMNGVNEIPTLQEIIDLAKSEEDKNNRIVGIIVNIRLSDYYASIGLPVEQNVVDTFHKNGYKEAHDPVIIESYSIDALKSLKNMTNLRLLQLMSSTSMAYDKLVTSNGLREVVTYAYGVAHHKSFIFAANEANNLGSQTSFVRDAQEAGLKVYAYTFRAENVFLPDEYKTKNASDATARGDLESEIKKYLKTGLNGVFTDNPDIAVQARGPC